MGSKAMLCLCFSLTVFLMIVSAKELTKLQLLLKHQRQFANTKVAEDANYPHDGYGGYPGEGYGGYPGGGYRGRGGHGGLAGYGGYCRWGCCGRNYYGRGCRCCSYAGEAFYGKQQENKP